MCHWSVVAVLRKLFPTGNMGDKAVHLSGWHHERKTRFQWISGCVRQTRVYQELMFGNGIRNVQGVIKCISMRKMLWEEKILHWMDMKMTKKGFVPQPGIKENTWEICFLIKNERFHVCYCYHPSKYFHQRAVQSQSITSDLLFSTATHSFEKCYLKT